jgi:hypothetical protein
MSAIGPILSLVLAAIRNTSIKFEKKAAFPFLQQMVLSHYHQVRFLNGNIFCYTVVTDQQYMIHTLVVDTNRHQHIQAHCWVLAMAINNETSAMSDWAHEMSVFFL